MVKFYFSNKAVDDLSEIWKYTLNTWSESQADKYYDLIIYSCKVLANDPKLGKAYDLISIELKGYKVGGHIIFYKIISKNEIEIIRILHDKMDLKSRI